MWNLRTIFGGRGVYGTLDGITDWPWQWASRPWVQYFTACELLGSLRQAAARVFLTVQSTASTGHRSGGAGCELEF